MKLAIFTIFKIEKINFFKKIKKFLKTKIYTKKKK